mmetsp:Transcript_2462/g.4801  ORF Transcript_2462/g.4801 Transcript_2462/m.4801 type:complete len:300 (+) Transcript_2462:583-1482(+)
MLRDAAWARGDLPLDLSTQLGHLQGGGDVAQSETGHGKAFAETVHHSGALIHVWQGSERGVRSPLVSDILVYLVRYHEYPWVLLQHLGQFLQLLFRIHRTGWVARRAEDKGTCARGDGGLELGGGHLVAILGLCPDDDWFATRHAADVGVRGPVGSRDDDFVAWGYQGRYKLHDALLRAIGAHNLSRRVIEAVVSLELLAYFLSQLYHTHGARVVRFACPQSHLGSLQNGLWAGCIIGFPNCEREYFLPLVLESSSQGVNLYGRGGLHGRHARVHLGLRRVDAGRRRLFLFFFFPVLFV